MLTCFSLACCFKSEIEQKQSRGYDCWKTGHEQES